MVRGRGIRMVRDPSRRALRFLGMTCLALLSCGCSDKEAGPHETFPWTEDEIF